MAPASPGLRWPVTVRRAPLNTFLLASLPLILVRVDLLGPLELRVDGEPVSVGGPGVCRWSRHRPMIVRANPAPIAARTAGRSPPRGDRLRARGGRSGPWAGRLSGAVQDRRQRRRLLRAGRGGRHHRAAWHSLKGWRLGVGVGARDVIGATGEGSRPRRHRPGRLRRAHAPDLEPSGQFRGMTLTVLDRTRHALLRGNDQGVHGAAVLWAPRCRERP